MDVLVDQRYGLARVRNDERLPLLRLLLEYKGKDCSTKLAKVRQ